MITHLVATALATVAMTIPATTETKVGDTVADAGASVAYVATGSAVEGVGATLRATR